MSTFEDEPITQSNPPVASQGVAPGARLQRLRLAVHALTWETIAYLALLSTAILTRFWNLGARVMSHDESEHVYFSWILSKGGGYAHNPMMHGPLLFELTAIFDAIFKATDFTSRLVPALIGISIVVVVPLLLRPWLGRWGALATSLFLLVSPYVLYYSRYNRHDIYEIAWVLVAVFALFSYLRARGSEEEHAIADSGVSPADSSAGEPSADEPTANELAAGERSVSERISGERSSGERWLLLLAGAEALMFSSMETAFFYLAIMASFLGIRLLVKNGFSWEKLRRAAEFDLLVVLATLGAFFSSPIALLVINPIWTRITGQPFVPLTDLSSFGIEWATGPHGMRIWGLMVVFWWAAVVVGIFWDWRRWLKLAGLFMAINIVTFTTLFTNWAGIGTGFIGSLGYWLSQQGVARGSQPWYYYFIVFPLYEYLPLLGGIAAMIYVAIRRRSLPATVRTFVLFITWWAVLIFVGLSAAGEKMPWLSTHITVPFILLTGWFVGHLIQRGLSGEIRRPAFAAALLPFAVLALMTARTAYFASYVNYDSVIEYQDYAHGAPGVKWLADDVAQIAAKTGQGKSLPVAFDSANAWPLTWYFRDHPGFYGDTPNRASLQNQPIIIAGQENWQKVESFLGPNYNRYDVIRIWWPMEDYKNLSWDRIRGALLDPKMRQAIWDIFWSRDYRLYASLTNETDSLNPPAEWPLQDRMRIYIRKDIAAQIPDMQLKQAQIADIPVQPDAYASKKISAAPVKVIQPAGLNGPRNMAFAPDGSLYVTDTGNSRIVHIDAQGKVIAAWGSQTPDKQVPPEPGTFNGPWGVAVDSKGNVYVADTWNHRIQKFDANGKFLLQWGTGGVATDGPDRFWGPRGIVVAPNGNLYITDTGNRRVVVFDPNGKFQFAFATDGQAALNEPVGIAIDSEGRVFVADTWNSRVAVFDLQGKFLSSWAIQAWSGTSVDEKPFITVDAAGRVYVTDPEGSRVIVFSANGEPQAEFGQLSNGEDGFSLPTGIVAGPQGNIWIADAGNNRLVVYPAVK